MERVEEELQETLQTHGLIFLAELIFCIKMAILPVLAAVV
jgi:hypothetical protein